MGRLKPIGSEKLEGMEKIARIMEIARYKENIPTPVNEHSSNEYSIKLADGYLYEICKEKNGYVIKKGLNESSLDYIEPMKNRRHFSSYSGAFKRLNVIAKEVNTITETEEGVSLFTEQKKYILKTPKSMEEQEGPSPAPAAAPSPASEPVPSPEPMTEPEMPSPEPMTEPEMPSDNEMDSHDELDNEDEVTLKTIQKLTGKLAQKIRSYETKEDEEMTGQDVKYVINSILSALDLDKLEDDDKEDIIDKVEGDGQEGDEKMMSTEPEPPSTEEMPSPEDMGAEESSEEMNEYQYFEDFIFDEPKEPYKRKFKGESHTDDHDKFLGDMIEGLFNESKVDKIIKGYFSLTESEKKQNKVKETAKTRTTSSKIQNIAESKKQEESARKFVKNNPNATLIGKSSKNNLLFECDGKTVKVTTNGQIL